MISLERYVALFSERDLRNIFLASVLGRLPIGLTGLAVLLLVQTSTGSFARGGAAAACYVAGLAAVAPAIGLFLRSPALRAWRIEVHTTASLLGPLADGRFVRLVMMVLCFATAFGLMEIGVTAYATEAGDAALAGVLLGVMSAGSALGGLAYGSRGWHYPLARQFATALAAMSAGLAVLALHWGPWLFAAWCVVAGVAMAPALIIQSMLVAKTAKAGAGTSLAAAAGARLLLGR